MPHPTRRGLLLGTLLLAGCGMPPILDGQTLIIGDVHNGQELTLAVYGDLVVELPARTSAGYGWSIVEQSPQLKLWSSPTIRPEKEGQPPGATMIESFAFRAIAPGKATLRLALTRPWETDREPAATYAVTIDIS